MSVFLRERIVTFHVNCKFLYIYSQEESGVYNALEKEEKETVGDDDGKKLWKCNTDYDAKI